MNESELYLSNLYNRAHDVTTHSFVLKQRHIDALFNSKSSLSRPYFFHALQVLQAPNCGLDRLPSNLCLCNAPLLEGLNLEKNRLM